MSGPDTIIRIAAKGDGVTDRGVFVPTGVPGDHLAPDGTLVRGPHYQQPPCQHFGTCGGCELQQADDDALTTFVTQRVVLAAKGQELEPQTLLPTHLSPPRTRRRATLHAQRIKKRTLIGFREGGAHRIVDLNQCEVMHPQLFALVQPLRDFVARFGPQKGGADIDLTLTDQGVDCSLKHIALEGLEPMEAALDLARDQGLARLSVDMGFGAEPIWEPEPVTITLGGQAVAFPSGSFLQATQDAEALMVADADAALEGADKVVDLFAGLGTFALALSGTAQVTAVEAAREALLACQMAGRRNKNPFAALHRDLFRNPLQAQELNSFDAAILDPPRAGARAQVAELAKSDLQRIVYISCNPSSWARDAKQLVEAGFALEKLRPVGQFRWSTHVELVSVFTR